MWLLKTSRGWGRSLVVTGRTLGSVAAGAIVASVACRQILGADKFSVVADSGSKSECDEPGYPDPPANSQSSGDHEFVVATKTQSWGDGAPGSNTYASLGYNLDLLCTGEQEGATGCAEPSWAVSDHADGPSGVDNALGRLLSNTYPGYLTIGDQKVENDGERSYLVRVRGYDGQADDGAVEVAFFAGATSAPGAPAVAPAWDGSDVWVVGGNWVDDNSVEKPKYVDEHAYVKGGVLVAHFPTLLIGAPFTDYATVGQVVLTGDIVSEGGAYRLENGVFAGRWPIGEVLGYLSAIIYDGRCVDPATTPNGSNYWQEIAVSCAYTDIRVEGDDPTQPCDGLSFAQAFDGYSATLGSAFPGQPNPPCTPNFGPAMCSAAAVASRPSADASRD